MLNIQGIFDRLEIDEDRKSVPGFYLAIRIRLPKERPDCDDVSLVFLDPDGELAFQPTVLEVTGPVAVVIIKQDSLKVRKAGVFHAVLREKNRMISSIPLFVAESPALEKVRSAHLN